MTAMREVAGEQTEFINSVQIFNTKHRNTLCIRFHTGVCSSRQIKPTLL